MIFKFVQCLGIVKDVHFFLRYTCGSLKTSDYVCINTNRICRGSRAVTYLAANLLFDLSIFTLTMIKTVQSMTGYVSFKRCPSLRSLRVRTREAFGFRHTILAGTTHIRMEETDRTSPDSGAPEDENSHINGTGFSLRHILPHRLDLTHLHPPLNSPLPSSCSPSPISAFESPLLEETLDFHIEEHQPLRSASGSSLFRKLARDGAIYFL